VSEGGSERLTSAPFLGRGVAPQSRGLSLPPSSEGGGSAEPGVVFAPFLGRGWLRRAGGC